MGLFKSEAEKEEERQAKLRVALAKYNLEDLSDEKDMESVKNIALEMTAYGWYDAAGLLGNDSAVMKQIAQTNKVIMEQNFILIRQLEWIHIVEIMSWTTFVKSGK